MLAGIAGGRLFTPKALNNKAQGRERSERTLGGRTEETTTPTGLYNRKTSEEDHNPGWRGEAADPGLCCETPFGVMRLRRTRFWQDPERLDSVCVIRPIL